ncbi:hypothetical protein [Cryptosporangium phraense]|uniref:Uncharacterized protein n=1 Tax=Cryptosporangium phraense TaxID=2593070 RepID=A0A545AF63_9ACTN|nr:hypothetical protein [Cryptosporangium phraense]TQS39949.1 hypothetical protein FL583_37335 [Cryptosporangium phraense]
MTSALLVPIHLDALPLSSECPTIGAAIDYSRLPYVDGAGDQNVASAYLSESIVDPPFHDEPGLLKTGVHLHWALPDALTQGVHTPDGTEFPAVPTRWLVTRSRLAADGTTTPEQRWVVESDYLAPLGVTGSSGVAFPFTGLIDDSAGPPFRYVGRSMTLAQWLDPGKDGGRPRDYLDRLTSAGYGHPSFAAIYPNCHSVFGFHDAVQVDPSGGLLYDVIGWYGRSADDFLGTWLRAGAGDPLDRLAADLGWAPRTIVTRSELRITGADPDALWRELHDRGWLTVVDDQRSLVMTAAYRAQRPLSDAFQAVAEQAGAVLDQAATVTLGSPEKMMCFGRLRFAPQPAADDTRLTLAVGNTGLEAVAGYLAAEIAPDRAPEVERLLGAVLELTGAGTPSPDVNAQLAEARHERTFRPVDGGTRWTISSQQKPGTAPDAEASDDLPDLPPDVSAALGELNRVQQAGERTRQQLAAARRELFADWYRYLLCAYPPYDELRDYPDVDTVKAFVERGLTPVNEAVVAAGRLDERRNALAARIERGLPDGGAYSLREVGAPRYYEPTEPVVLLVGDLVRPSPRYGQDHTFRPDAVLDTRIIDVDLSDPVAMWTAAEPVWAELAQAADAGREQLGFKVWRRAPWHPVLLEWEVSYSPRVDDRGVPGTYDRDFLTGSYLLDAGAGDLALRAGRGAVEPGTEFYSGSSILTPSAVDRLRSLLVRYLVGLALGRDNKAFFAAVPVAVADRTTEYLTQNAGLVIDWYATAPAGDPVRTVVEAYRRLGDSFPALAQALSGFNAALLSRKQTTQMPIADPFGFADDQGFIAAVREAVGRGNDTAPMPLADFNPIRAGALEVSRLRLIDSFGQIRDLAWDRLVIADSLREPGNSRWVGLPPRIVQPARVNLRWLAADAAHTEAGAHAATTPICGWILPNHLDDSLAVYDRDGVALGEIDQFAGWKPSPGALAPVTLAQLHDPAFTGINAHLRRLVARLTRAPGVPDSGESVFLASFLETIEATLDAIEPDGADAQHELAFLFGRPMAVVRALVDVELKESPAVNQSWPAFGLDLRRATRDTRGFPQVRFPIRIGAPEQFDDGVVGYWKESDGGLAGTFYAAEPSDHPRIVSLDRAEACVQQAVSDPPQELTMLLDARGSVHATSGVLPTKVITVPAEQFTDALAAMEVSFLTAPLLTARDQLRVALPTEPGYRWSWLAPAPGPTWIETHADATLSRSVFEAHFPAADALWAHLLDPEIRWLVPVGLSATVLSAPERRSAVLLGDFAGLEAWTDRALGLNAATGAAPAALVTVADLGALPTAEAVWTALVDPATGWLTPLDGQPDRAAIVPVDQRPGAETADQLTGPVLSGALAGLEGRLGLLFDDCQTGIAPMRADAHSTGPQEVREGWLMLRPVRRSSDESRT